MKILLLFLFFGLSLFASIGKISALNGKVIVDRQAKLLDADLGFNLEEKDFILTDEKSKAQITLNDGTVLSIGKNSKLNINEYVFDEKDSSNSKAEFKFVEGTFKSITGAIGKVAPEKFKLETKSASIGIRGTIVVGNQDKIACTHGQIAVTSAGVTQILNAGMMTNTEMGKAPTTPKKIEGSLLKEVDSVGTKEESKSTTTQKEASNESKSESSQTSNTQTSQSSSIPNLSSLTEVVKSVNNVTTQKSQEQSLSSVSETKNIDAAILLANQSINTFENISSSSLSLFELASTLTKITQSTDITNETQNALNNATTTSISIEELLIQYKTIPNELLSLTEQLKTAGANVSGLYNTIQTKSDSLIEINSKLSEKLLIAQNNLKTVILSLANSINTQSTMIAQNISLIASNTAKSSALAAQTAIEASSNTLSEAENAKKIASKAATTANELSIQAQTIINELSNLLEQAQNTSATESFVIYEQIKSSSNILVSLLSQATEASTIALNSSKTVVNLPLYSTELKISQNGNNSVGSKIFNVLQNDTTVTIATYTTSTEMDPVLILLKKDAEGVYKIYNVRDDDSWTKSPSYYNSILNVKLEKGEYMVAVADFPFENSEALVLSKRYNDAGTINLYITSSSALTFDSSEGDTSVYKYSYIQKYNNQAYINNLNYTNSKIEENNPLFGILADSKVGTTIKIDDYGFFVTISDSFDNTNNAFLNSVEVDDGSSWGYWTNASSSLYSIRDMQSVWVSGNKVTPATNYKATFTGQVIGSVIDNSRTGHITLDNNNLFQATIDIGTASITNSTIKFDDSLNNKWSGTFNTSGSNVNTNGFSANIVSSKENNSIFSTENSINSIVNPSVNNVGGSLSGNYYGVNNQVKSIGGSFNMTQGTSTANGVFKARAGVQ